MFISADEDNDTEVDTDAGSYSSCAANDERNAHGVSYRSGAVDEYCGGTRTNFAKPRHNLTNRWFKSSGIYKSARISKSVFVEIGSRLVPNRVSADETS